MSGIRKPQGYIGPLPSNTRQGIIGFTPGGIAIPGIGDYFTPGGEEPPVGFEGPYIANTAYLSGTSDTMTLPSAENGDYFVMYVATPLPSGSIGSPSGWTTINSGLVSGRFAWRYMRKAAGATPDTTVTFSSDLILAICLTIRNWNGVNANARFGSGASNYNNSVSSNPVPTTANDPYLGIHFVVWDVINVAASLTDPVDSFGNEGFLIESQDYNKSGETMTIGCSAYTDWQNVQDFEVRAIQGPASINSNVFRYVSAAYWNT